MTNTEELKPFSQLLTSINVSPINLSMEKDKIILRLKIQVKPQSRIEKLVAMGDHLTIKINAPAIEGKANSAVIKLLAKSFGVAPSQLLLISGMKSKEKIIEITMNLSKLKPMDYYISKFTSAFVNE